MADQQIGNLLILLEANTAKMDQQIQQSKAHFDSFKGTLDTVRDALIAVGAFAVLDKVIAAAEEAEKAHALLASQIKATGDASGYTQQQLEDMAESFSHTTTSSKEQVEGLEAELMAFRNIAGQQFQGAIQAALDFSAVTGHDAAQAVRALGLALNDPISGMKGLRRAGIDLTDQVKETVKALAEQGDLVGAQNILLNQMEKSYGGAAAAARDTLGGALAGLKNDFHELLAGNGAPQLTQSIKDLDQTLQDPNVKEGIANLVAGLAALVSWAAQAASKFNEIGQGLAAIFAGGVGNAIDDIGDKLGQARKDLQAWQTELEHAKAGTNYNDNLSVDEIEGKIKQQKILVQQLQAAWDTLLRGHNSDSARPRTFTAGDVDPLLTPDLGHIKNIDSPQELDPGNFGGLKSQADQMREDQQQVIAIWKQNDPSAFLKQEIDKTNQLVGTVVNGTIFTTDDAAKHIDDLKSKFGESMDQMSEFSKQAARNIQDELGSALFDGFHDGLRGMLEDFAKTLEKMVDQLIASQLLNQFFGGSDPNNKGSGQAGLAALISKGLGQYFGGGHAAGGPVDPSNFYMVGEQGPELFVPSSAGSIIPNGGFGGAGGGDVHVNIDARGSDAASTSRLLAMRAALENSLKSQMEYRLQRGGWPQGRRA